MLYNQHHVKCDYAVPYIQPHINIAKQVTCNKQNLQVHVFVAKQTCYDNRVCSGLSELQCHLMFMFMHCQMILIGEPLM